MGDNQYDVPESLQKLFLIKQKQREEAKAYFKRHVTNPHRPLDAGVLFDPVIHRYTSLTAYQIEHFRATPKTYKYLFLTFLIPVAIVYEIFSIERSKKWEKLRNGEVAYKDRKFKLIN